ncbi:MAG: cyclic pyranopterin monophosphate synthase MoaC [Acidimicrobiales bacterium]
MTLTAKVLTVSDSVAGGTRSDRSGAALAARLTTLGFAVVETAVVPDGIAPVSERIRAMADGFDGLVVTTGGTGFGPRDLTPEASALVIERQAPGLAEAIRSAHPLGALSRGVAGVVGACLVVNLPGSPTAVEESIDVVAPLLPHILSLLAGEPTEHPVADHHTTGRHVAPPHEPDARAHPAAEPDVPGQKRGGGLTHVDPRGHARMVDVSGKPATRRLARAACRVVLPAALQDCLPPETPESEVLGEARIAGIQGAKLTASLVPLCHPLALSAVVVDLTPFEESVLVSATAETVERTGVEMEALTACTLAALTVVGACRSSDPPPHIEDLTLWEKLGGRSGHWRRPGTSQA